MANEGGYLAREDGGRKLLLALVGFVAFAVVGYFARPLFQAVFHPQWTAERMEAELERDPTFRDVFLALKQNYPADSRALVEQAVADANRDDVEAANRNAFLFMRRFSRAKAEAMTRAPADQLHQIAQEYSGLMHALKNSDTNLCARVVMEGFRPGDHPPGAALDHINRIGALQIQAAHAGEAAGLPARTPLSDRDGAAFGSAVRANDASVAPLMTNEAALRAAPPDRQCAMGVALYDAAAELPLETSANVTAQLLRVSLSQ
jgi:hypothetical protein